MLAPSSSREKLEKFDLNLKKNFARFVELKRKFGKVFFQKLKKILISLKKMLVILRGAVLHTRWGFWPTLELWIF